MAIVADVVSTGGVLFMADKQSYPRMPGSNWWTLRAQFQKALPATVTVSYLKSLLGLNDEKAARNLIYPLRQLGIIDEEGKPLPRANDWRSDTKYPEACKAMIEEVYPQELRDLFPTGENRRGIAEWFMHTASLGSGAASQVAAMYTLLCDATIKTSDDKSTKTEKKLRSKTNANKTEAQPTLIQLRDNKEKNVDMPATIATTAPVAWSPAVHIDLQIHISPEATSEQIDVIFASMSKHLFNR